MALIHPGALEKVMGSLAERGADPTAIEPLVEWLGQLPAAEARVESERTGRFVMDLTAECSGCLWALRWFHARRYLYVCHVELPVRWRRKGRGTAWLAAVGDTARRLGCEEARIVARSCPAEGFVGAYAWARAGVWAFDVGERRRVAREFCLYLTARGAPPLGKDEQRALTPAGLASLPQGREFLLTDVCWWGVWKIQ